MKSETGSFVGTFLTPLTPQEPSKLKLAAQNRHTGSFTEHLHSAETKRPQAKSFSRAKPDVQVCSAKEVRSSVSNGYSTKVANHAKPTDSSRPARPPAFAPRITVPRDLEQEAETGSATGIPDAAGSAAPTEAEEEEALPGSELPQTTPANQVMLATPPVLSAPPVIPPPTNPLPATCEVSLVTAGSSEVSPEQSIETVTPDLSTKRELADEKNVSASALELEEQVKPDEQQATLAGDPGESGEGESQQPMREDNSQLDALTLRLADSAGHGDGTAAAKQMLPMKNAVEMENSAGPAVKNLPGAERVLEVPVARVLSRVEEARATRHDLQVDAAVSHYSASTTLSSGTTTATASTASASEVPAVEQVARAVMEGVARMRHTGTESVTVVLKPDGGTELWLRVEMRDGALSAQLHFERGDRGALEQHWDELQRRLAGQGVRLSRADDAGLGGHAQFAQSQRRPLDPEDDSMTNASPTFTRKISNNQTMTRRSARGFETWA